MSTRSSDDEPLDATAERVADFVSEQIVSSAPASSSEREFVRRLASFRRLRRSRTRFAVGAAITATLVAGGLAGLRLGGEAPTASVLSYRVDNQDPPSGGYILVPQTADALLAFSDGSKVRLAARTRGRVVEVNNRGAKVALDDVYAYLQQGADAQAGAQIERLLATRNLEPSAKTAFHLASTRARYALERRAWREAAALVPRQPAVVDWDRFPWPEAVTWFARGYGALKSGDGTEPPRALAQLKELERRATDAGESVFARQIQVLRWDLEGWMAHAAHDDSQALNLLRQAVELEGSTPKPPVTPAATLPAPELLGDLLLELGRADEALAAYRQSLQRFPRRFNGTLGIARALAAVGDQRGAADAYRQLLELGCNGTRAAALDDVRPFAQGQGVCKFEKSP